MSTSPSEIWTSVLFRLPVSISPWNFSAFAFIEFSANHSYNDICRYNNDVLIDVMKRKHFPLYRWIPPQRAINLGLWCCLCCYPKTLLNKQSSWISFGTPWRTCDATEITKVITLFIHLPTYPAIYWTSECFGSGLWNAWLHQTSAVRFCMGGRFTKTSCKSCHWLVIITKFTTIENNAYDKSVIVSRGKCHCDVCGGGGGGGVCFFCLFVCLFCFIFRNFIARSPNSRLKPCRVLTNRGHIRSIICHVVPINQAQL